MKTIAIALASAAALFALTALPASAVTTSAARTACIDAAATQHNEMKGNIQVRKVKHTKSGAEVNLQVKGAEVNCMVSPKGKVRYIN